ncbi:MAG: DUF3789 domain-containing protein [Ruminococcus sp.]|nr:DUF3789 domain-containing protein [Ruminococcus sp.]
MLGFIIGTFVGGAVGVTTMCMCRIAGDEDRRTEALTEDENEHPS